jgi:hypothetical protein
MPPTFLSDTSIVIPGALGSSEARRSALLDRDGRRLSRIRRLPPPSEAEVLRVHA